MTRLVGVTALLLALWAGDAAAATIRLNLSPSPATVGERVTIGASYGNDHANVYVRVYAETGGSTCASTAAAQDARSGVTRVISQLAP